MTVAKLTGEGHMASSIVQLIGLDSKGNPSWGNAGRISHYAQVFRVHATTVTRLC